MIQFACDAFWTFIGVLCYAAAGGYSGLYGKRDLLYFTQ